MPFLVFGQYFLGTFVLFVDHLLHFFVNRVPVLSLYGRLKEYLCHYSNRGWGAAHTQIGKSYRTPAWSRVPSHSWLRWISLPRIGLRQHASQGGTHLIKHLFLGGDLPFFRQIPSRAQSASTGYNGYFNSKIGVFQCPEILAWPASCSGNRTAFALVVILVFFSNPPTIRSTASRKSCFPTNFLPWRAAIKAASLHTLAMSAPGRIREVHVPEGLHPHLLVYLDGAQVYTEYFLTLIKVG